MARRFALLCAVVLATVAFAQPQAQARTTRRIEITLSCKTRSGWVSDSTLRARRGDIIEFVLTPASDVRDFVVAPKPRLGILPGRWLFHRRELDGAPGRPAVGNDMKPDAEGRCSYKVIGICQGGPNARIDPDIIIDI